MNTIDRTRDLVSHRVTFSYENGTLITGYVASCRPSTGIVRTMTLSKVEISDELGHLIEQHKEMIVIPSVLVTYQITEGPSASPSSRSSNL